MIEQGYSAYGPRWEIISKMLPGRTGDSVRNRWTSLIRARQSAELPVSADVPVLADVPPGARYGPVEAPQETPLDLQLNLPLLLDDGLCDLPLLGSSAHLSSLSNLASAQVAQ